MLQLNQPDQSQVLVLLGIRGEKRHGFQKPSTPILHCVDTNVGNPGFVSHVAPFKRRQCLRGTSSGWLVMAVFTRTLLRERRVIIYSRLMLNKLIPSIKSQTSPTSFGSTSLPISQMMSSNCEIGSKAMFAPPTWHSLGMKIFQLYLPP